MVQFRPSACSDATRRDQNDDSVRWRRAWRAPVQNRRFEPHLVCVRSVQAEPSRKRRLHLRQEVIERDRSMNPLVCETNPKFWIELMQGVCQCVRCVKSLGNQFVKNKMYCGRRHWGIPLYINRDIWQFGKARAPRVHSTRVYWIVGRVCRTIYLLAI